MRQPEVKRRPTDTLKAPKMRFHIGEFIRANREVNLFARKGELFCIVLAYRLISNPNEWVYRLEARKNVETPETPVSLALASIAPVNRDRIIYEPVRDSFADERMRQRTRNDYHHGDSMDCTNKELVQNFTVVSSGEVQQ